MKLTQINRNGLDAMCTGPLCFHGFNLLEKVFVKSGGRRRVNYICFSWGGMIPN